MKQLVAASQEDGQIVAAQRELSVAHRFLRLVLVLLHRVVVDQREPSIRELGLQVGGQDAAVLYGSPQQLVVAPDPPVGGASPAADTDLPALTPWSTGTYAIAFTFAADRPGLVRWLQIDIVAGAGEPAAATSGPTAPDGSASTP